MGFFDRFIPGPGPAWPYTNMQQINLDWIIYEVKTLGHNVEEYKTQLDQMGVDIEEFRAYIDGIDATIQNKINTEVPLAIHHEIQTGGFNTLLSDSHKRRIVFIGDSYGQGWTPDGTYPNWIQKAVAMLGLSNNDYYNSSAGGAAFGKSANDGNMYVPTLINNAYNAISNPETVTDVVIGLGYNDYLFVADVSQIKAGIVASCNISKQKFPNARIHIFAIGFSTDNAKQYALSKAYAAYSSTLADFQYYNISRALAESSLFSTDGIHPVENGQQNIALAVVRGLNNSQKIHSYPGDLSASSITFEMLIGDEQDVSGLMSFARSGNDIFMTNAGIFKLVTLGETTATLTGGSWKKIAKVKTCPYLGFYYPRPYIGNGCIMYYSVSGSNDFLTKPVYLTLAQDQANNDSNIYLWMQIQDAAGSSFSGVTNMTRFGFICACTKLEFITNHED